MKFLVDFNYHSDPLNTSKNLESLGAKLVGDYENSYYELEINNLEELQELFIKVNKLAHRTFEYSLVVNMVKGETPAIYFDNKV